MSIKILTKKSIDNTNIDGARQNHFSAGMRSGIVKGSLNEGRFFASASNIIALDTCVLLISGHPIIIDSVQYITFTSKPTKPTRYSMIAEISINENSEPTFRLFIQTTQAVLIQQNLFNTESGAGTYQIKIGNFTLDTNGEIQDVVRTSDLITGSALTSDGLLHIGNVVTNTLDEGVEAEVDVENRYDPETDKTYTDFIFSVPRGRKGEPNNLKIGTVENGDNASATITGESPNQTLNLVLPRGEKGEKGIQGSQGVQGETGPIGPQGVQGWGFANMKRESVNTTLETAQSWVGRTGDGWANCQNFDGRVGDLVMIPITFTDQGNSQGYMVCKVTAINGTQLTCNNLELVYAPQGPKGDAAGVTVNGVATNVNFSSDPQTQLNNLSSRLSSLGFKQGELVIDSTYLSTTTSITKNSLSRQGNYVIGDLEINDSSTSLTGMYLIGANQNQIIQIPSEFRPLDNTSISAYVKYACMDTSNFSSYTQYSYEKITVSSDGFVPIPDMNYSTLVGYVKTIKIHFGYEAKPL